MKTTSTLYISTFLLFTCISIGVTVNAQECLSLIDPSVEGNTNLIVQAENYSDAFDIEEMNLANIADPQSKGVDVEMDAKYAKSLIVSYIRDTEWLEYNVDAKSIPSEFTIAVSYSGAHKVISSSANVFINGEEVTNALVFPTTTSYKVYGMASSIPLTLSSSDNDCLTLRILFNGGGINVNYLEIQGGVDGNQDTVTDEEDENDKDDKDDDDKDDDDDKEVKVVDEDKSLVAEIQSSNCDASFKDATSEIQAEDVFRAKDNEMENKYTGIVETVDGFDLKIHDAFDKGQAVGYIKPGEWLEYDIAFPEAGSYVVDLYYGMGKPDVSKVQLYFDEVSVGAVDLLNTSSDLVVKSVLSEPITVNEQQLCTSFRLEWELGKFDFDKFQFKIIANGDVLDYEEYIASKIVDLNLEEEVLPVVVVPVTSSTTTSTATAAVTTATATIIEPGVTILDSTSSTTTVATATTPAAATSTLRDNKTTSTPSIAGGSVVEGEIEDDHHDHSDLEEEHDNQRHADDDDDGDKDGAAGGNKALLYDNIKVAFIYLSLLVSALVY